MTRSQGLGCLLRGRVLAAAIAVVVLVACADSGEQRLEQARADQDAGRFAQSALELRAVLADEPGHAEANFRLGMALVQLGRFSEAAFALQRASKSDEYGAKASLLLAAGLLRSRNFEEVIAAADRVLELEADSVPALVLRTQALLGMGSSEDALATLDRLEARLPGDPRWPPLRARGLAAAGRLDEAEAVYRAAIEQSAKPEHASRACIALAAFVRDEREDPEAAGEVAVECVERFPDQPGALISVAQLYGSIERQEEAIALLEDGVARLDSNALRVALARSLVAARRVEEAQALLLEYAENVQGPRAWASVAELRTQLRDFEGSLEAWDMAIRVAPEPVELLRYGRADSLVDLGRFAEAQEEATTFEAALYRDIISARIAQAQGDPERALELYTRALAEWPDHTLLRTRAAVAALDLGRVSRAKEELREVTRHAASGSDAAFWLARVHMAEGEFVNAAAMADRHLKERGADPEVFVLKARALAALGRVEGAQATLAEFAALEDGAYEAYAVSEATRMVRKAEGPAAALAQLDEQVAQRKLDLADPRNEPVIAERVELLLALRRVAEARAQLDALLVGHRDSAPLHAILGRIAIVEGSFDAAAAAFDRALELDPELASAYAGRATLALRRGQAEAALADMERAVAIDPIPAYQYMVARMQLDAGEVELGRRGLEVVLRADPEHALAANDLAYHLARDGGDLDRALGLAERAVRLEPLPQVLDTLGYVRLKRGELLRARAAFEAALEKKSSYATARYHLALVMLEQGDEEEARETLRVALERRFPEESAARTTLAQLEGGASVQ